METCKVCNKNETNKKVDGVPVCSECYIKDAKANHGRAVNYSNLLPKADKAKETAKETGKPKGK